MAQADEMVEEYTANLQVEVRSQLEQSFWDKVKSFFHRSNHTNAEIEQFLVELQDFNSLVEMQSAPPASSDDDDDDDDDDNEALLEAILNGDDDFDYESYSNAQVDVQIEKGKFVNWLKNMINKTKGISNTVKQDIGVAKNDVKQLLNSTTSS
jgi:hypothetical protein